MINIAIIKENSKKSVISTNLRTTNPYKSYAESEYDKKKLQERKDVHEQILRIAMQSSFV